MEYVRGLVIFTLDYICERRCLYVGASLEKPSKTTHKRGSLKSCTASKVKVLSNTIYSNLKIAVDLDWMANTIEQKVNNNLY